ncbi:hypothetical protein QVD17_37437 [Tagetes erecta]|uniref:Uncharacterized protein n=1 Tax=Tagetes erecta TaxID=13708 RepID=A0AAD8NCQ4_TARER|nr:hypothetical protein QVD17_37437 [Tagetes erecta]
MPDLFNLQIGCEYLEILLENDRRSTVMVVWWLSRDGCDLGKMKMKIMMKMTMKMYEDDQDEENEETEDEEDDDDEEVIVMVL